MSDITAGCSCVEYSSLYTIDLNSEKVEISPRIWKEQNILIHEVRNILTRKQLTAKAALPIILDWFCT